MLKKRIIAKFLIERGTLVKFRKFTEQKRSAGNALSTVLVYEDYGVDEMILCDVGGIDADLVRAVTEEVFTPITVAGGIREMDIVKRLIGECGADKVVVKSLALAESVAAKYGSQAVVWPIDYSGECTAAIPDCVGEVLLTDVNRDGTGVGFDLAALAHDWKVPVVICGGCGQLDHAKQAFDAGADGVAISSMFFFTDKSPIKLRSWLSSNGVSVRA